MAVWQPSPEDLRRVLDEQNPWHQSGRVPDALAPPVERPLAQLLWRRLLLSEPRRFNLILGPRRVGKTTAMYQTARHLLDETIAPDRIWWLRLDHPLLLDVPLGHLVRAIPTFGNEEEPVILLLDELVYAREWDLWLKTFYDERWPVRVLGTSSATAALSHRRLESGIGRWDEHQLSPYLYSEYLDLAGAGVELPVGLSFGETVAELARAGSPRVRLESHLRRFLLVGGFPELLAGQKNVEDEQQLLLVSQQTLRNDAIERAIYKDIPQSFGVDNPLMLERVLYVLAGQMTGLVSVSALASQLGISQPTFDRYLSFLQRAFLVFTTPNYSGREATVQRRGRKVFFVDGAVRNAALQRGLAPLDNAPELGLLRENLVASTLQTLAVHSGVRLYHWRDGKREVDFVVDHPDFPLAIEVGSSADHTRSGLQALVERHPRFEGRCYLIAPNAPPMTPEATASGVGTLPLEVFLIAAGRQAERALEARVA